MRSEKSDEGRFRTHKEIEIMVERIKAIIQDIPEEKGFKTVLNNFIIDLVNYPEQRCIFDETRNWIMHKPELLEDYLLGMQGLIQFIKDVMQEGILFFADDIYKEDCALAREISSKYHIWKSSKAIYWLSYLINNKIVFKQGDTYFREPAFSEREFEY